MFASRGQCLPHWNTIDGHIMTAEVIFRADGQLGTVCMIVAKLLCLKWKLKIEKGCNASLF